MPDADDFDVEYFRNLLKGGNPEETQATPASPPPQVAKSGARRTVEAPVPKGKKLPATGRKKPAPGTKSGKKERSRGR